MSEFFISYNHNDFKQRDELVQWITHEYPNLRYWYDAHDLKASQDWWNTIQQNIRECRIFFFLLSNDTLESEYCLEEFRLAYKRRKTIVPLILRQKIDFGKAPAEIINKLNRIQNFDITHGIDATNTAENLRQTIDQILKGAPTNLAGLDILRIIFRDQPTLLGDAETEISGSMITDLTMNLSFGRPVNFYLTGRTMAGKSTLSNVFMKVNKVGYGDTTEAIGHSGFGTGFQIFDLPGQAGLIYLENVNRLVLGLPLKHEPKYPRPGEKKLTSIKYRRYFFDTRSEEKLVPLEGWPQFVQENTLVPDLVLYVLNPAHGFLDADFEYLVDSLKYLEQQQKLNRLVFILNEYNKPNDFLEYRQTLFTALNQAYSTAGIVNNTPISFIVNAQSGQGLDDLFQYICQILPAEAIGQIKDIVNRDYREDINSKLRERYTTIIFKTAARVARFLPFEKSAQPLTIYELVCRAFFDLSLDLLAPLERKEEFKALEESIYAAIAEQAMTVLTQAVDPQRIKVAKIGKKSTTYQYQYFDEDDDDWDDDWDDDKPWIDVSDEFFDADDYQSAKKYAPDETDVNYYTTTGTSEYEAIVGFEWVTFSGLDDSYVDPEIGELKIKYYEERVEEVGGKKAAFEKYRETLDKDKAKSYLEVDETRKVEREHPVPDGVISTSIVHVEPKFKSGGINALAMMLGTGLELSKVVQGHYDDTHGQSGYSNISHIIDAGIRSVFAKLEPISNQIEELLISNDRNSEDDILRLITDALRQ